MAEPTTTNKDTKSVQQAPNTRSRSKLRMQEQEQKDQQKDKRKPNSQQPTKKRTRAGSKSKEAQNGAAKKKKTEDQAKQTVQQNQPSETKNNVINKQTKPKDPKIWYVEFFDGNQRDRHRIGQMHGKVLLVTVHPVKAYVECIKHILDTILDNEVECLAKFLHHKDCGTTANEETKTIKKIKQEPNPLDVVEKSLWKVAEKGAELEEKEIANQSYLTNQQNKERKALLNAWEMELYNHYDSLKPSDRKDMITTLQKWFLDMRNDGFGLYAPDEGHWLKVQSSN